MEKHAEFAMIVQLLCDRKLFGCVYSALHPDDHEQHVPDSGVLVMPTVPTNWLSAEVRFPGDIDVVAIPYEGTELLLGQTLAFEVKVIRASFAKQGKSPNEYGFSQAKGLLNLGIPYVGVVHLIVSDSSPPTSWRTMWLGDVLDADRVGNLREMRVDMLPSDLIYRAFNRLVVNSPRPDLGLASVYVEDILRTKREGMWFPKGRIASWNEQATVQSIRRIAELYEAHSASFLETPRYAPPIQ